MSIATPDSEHRDGFTPEVERALDDLIALVEVYQSLPAEALRIALAARGFGQRLDLERLDHPYLVALAVHTHTPGWKDVRRLRRSAHRPQPLTGPVMVDVPI
jgi:hypothetical protein